VKIGKILDKPISCQSNAQLMATSSIRHAVPLFRHSPAFRALALVVLVASLGIEALSCTFVESTAAAPAGGSGFASRVEPPQVCDGRGPFNDVLFDIPVVVPVTCSLSPSPAAWRHLPRAMVFSLNGFHAPIDHPPQLRS